MSQRIEENMHLVAYVINYFYNGGSSLAKFHGVEVDDLYQIGMIGLVKADRGFSYEYNASFYTYAIHKIHGELRRFFRDNNQCVKFPRTIKDIARSLQDLDTLSIESIMEKTGVSRIDALAVMDYTSRKPLSMNHVLRVDPDTGDEVTFEHVLPAKVDTADEALRNVELNERLAILNAKTRHICSLMLKGYSQTAAAKEAGISQSRASRHISNAVKLIEKEYSIH